MKFRGRNPFRCRRCSYRFYRKLQPGEVLGLPDPPLHPAEPRPPAAESPDAVLDSHPEQAADSPRK